jgi:hypothetical protein
MNLSGTLGIKDELDEAAHVTKVDKDKSAVVAAPVNPAADGDIAVNAFLFYFSAIVSAHDSCSVVGIGVGLE